MAREPQSITTSIRLPIKLRDELDRIAEEQHHGKNWIITRAIEEYLAKSTQAALIETAKEQSLRASISEHPEDNIWEENTDTAGWK